MPSRAMAFRLLAPAALLLVARPASSGGVIEVEVYRAIGSASLNLKIENVDVATLPGVLSFVHTQVVGEHFPEDNVPAKVTARPTSSDEGGFDPVVFQNAENSSGADIQSLYEARQEHPDELDPVAVAGGAFLEKPVLDAVAAAAAQSQAFLRGATGAGAGSTTAAPEGEAASSRPHVLRVERHKGVDTIFRTDLKVRNTQALLSSKQVFFVDFGPEVDFQNGEAQGKGYKWDYGDFVGAAQHVDKRTPQLIPGFWFSISGVCPNQPWDRKGAPPKLNAQCMVHPSGTGKLMGGLCPNGDNGDAVPTGEVGCTYTYRRPVEGSRDVLRLDDLSGITKEDCGGRPCMDWRDFREHCSNQEYKQMFNYGRRRTVAKTKYCIEYDIHPACVESCNTKECKALRESEKEVGLPFWRGRCVAAANLNRTEQLAAAFSIPGATEAHETMEAKSHDNAQTCLTGAGEATCSGKPTFCTREWSGVCQTCYIPGAAKLPADSKDGILCPWAVLDQQDYASNDKPPCKTTKARDLCCLYTGTCDGITLPAEAEAVPLDEDGYAAVLAARSTDTVKSFLTRYHHELEGGELADEAALQAFAYWEWGKAPQAGRTLERAAKLTRAFFAFPTTTATKKGSHTTTHSEEQVKARTTRRPRRTTTAEPEDDERSFARTLAPSFCLLLALGATPVARWLAQ